MRKIIKYQTNSGQVFDSEQQARRHLDDEYGNKLEALTHGLMAHKYGGMIKWLDENLERFDELIKLKKELKETTDDDDWDY